MKHCRRIPVALPDPAIIKSTQPSRCWSPFPDFNKPNFSCKFFVKNCFAKSQEPPALLCWALQVPKHTQKSLTEKNIAHKKCYAEQLVQGLLVLQCCFLLNIILTSSTIPKNHLEEGAAVENLTDPLFGVTESQTHPSFHFQWLGGF